MSIQLANQPRFRFVQALRYRSFALVWTGQTISALGDGAYVPALAWQVLVLTHSGTAMGIVLAATTVARLTFLLVGGLVADRFPRRLLLFWSDALRAVIVLTIAGLGWSHQLQVWHLVVLGVTFGVIGAFFMPAYRAMPPQLVEKAAFPSANALIELSGQLGQLLGPLLGAGLVAASSPSTAFAFDGVTFAVSALSLLAIRSVNTTAETQHERSISVRSDLRAAFGLILHSPWLLTTILIPAFGNASFGGSMIVALPKLVHDVYGTGVWLLGMVGTAIAAGRIAAAFLVGQFRLPRRGVLAFCADIVAALAILAFVLPVAHNWHPPIALVAGICYGLGGGTFQTIWVTLLHELVPNDQLGRVASIDLLGSFCLQPIGFAVAGLVADQISPVWVFVGAGTLNLLLYSTPLCLGSIRRVT